LPRSRAPAPARGAFRAASTEHPAGEIEVAKSLGENIRGLRRAQGMTLEDVAARCNLSVGFLSQVEHGKKRPSTAALQRISETLKVAVGFFFPQDPGADPRERGIVVRHRHRRRLSYSALGSTDYLKEADYLLSPSLDGKQMMTLVDFEPGGATGDDLYRHEGEECGFILSGRLELHVEADVFLLETGDSFSFKSDVPHRYVNPGPGKAELVMVNTPVVIRY
jgi:transcriptional regulator with XRE-family HTH domain